MGITVKIPPPNKAPVVSVKASRKKQPITVQPATAGSEVTVQVPKVKKSPVVQVKVSNTGQIISTTPVTVKTTTPGPGRFDELLDVDATVEVEGAVPVFDPITGKYKVERLDISEVTGGAGSAVIDGGEF